MWEEAVGRLSDKVGQWVRERGWVCVVHSPEPGEALVELQGADGRFYFEPAEFSGRTFPAVVWFYAYPTMRRVRLASSDGTEWQIQSSDGIPFHKTLTEATFAELIRDLSMSVA